MEEYIKKNAVLDKEFEAEINTYDGFHEDSVEYVILASDVYKMPAEDVAPVVHGWWVKHNFSFDDCACVAKGWKCSNCNTPTLFKTKYCHECGAKMDRSVET